MTPRRVRFTTTAQEHVRRERAWWLENRTHIDIFATELEQALKILAVLPGTGTSYLLADASVFDVSTCARSAAISTTRSTTMK